MSKFTKRTRHRTKHRRDRRVKYILTEYRRKMVWQPTTRFGVNRMIARLSVNSPYKISVTKYATRRGEQMNRAKGWVFSSGS